MNIENIHDDWGVIINLDSPQEFFEQPIDYWRSLLYDKKIIFFKVVNFTRSEYAEFGMHFGRPWLADAYTYSNEGAEPVDTKYGTLTISPFSEKSKAIGIAAMPWHSDIPNKDFTPYPFRSLWIVGNPNPKVSGKTSWLNLEKAISYLTPEMTALLPRITVVQQSWYEPGTDVKELPLLKTHPITGKQSLRLNYYNWEQRKDAWITGVKIDGVLQADCRLIKEWLEHLEKIPELVYEHTWDTNDIAIYDNWTFVHARTRVFLDPATQTRKFFRINIDHLNDTQWDQHKGAI